MARLVGGGHLVVLARDDLLVVRVGSLDEPGEDLGGRRTEAEVVLAPRHLDLVVGQNSLRICSSALGGTIRSAWAPPAVAVGTSILASRWPLVATIRMRSGLSSHSTPLRIGRLSSVLAAKATWVIELLQVAGGGLPAAVELDCREGGNSSGQAEQPELGAAALDGDPLLARRGDPDRGAGQLAHDLGEFAGRER